MNEFILNEFTINEILYKMLTKGARVDIYEYSFTVKLPTPDLFLKCSINEDTCIVNLTLRSNCKDEVKISDNQVIDLGVIKQQGKFSSFYFIILKHVVSVFKTENRLIYLNEKDKVLADFINSN